MSPLSRLVLYSGLDDEWAQVFDAHLRAWARKRLHGDTTPIPDDFRRSPSARGERDFGSYLCMLLALQQEIYEHHHHAYVGSGTSTAGNGIVGGIGTRASARMHPISPNLFHNLLQVGKPLEPIWIPLWVIKGSRDEEDSDVRSYNAFVCRLAEAILHDLMRSWLLPDGQTPRRPARWESCDWWGTNSGSLLAQSMAQEIHEHHHHSYVGSRSGTTRGSKVLGIGTRVAARDPWSSSRLRGVSSPQNVWGRRVSINEGSLARGRHGIGRIRRTSRGRQGYCHRV